MRYLTLILVLMLTTHPAVAMDKPKAAVKEAVDPDCDAGKAAKGAAMKATVGVGNRCGVAETVKDAAGVDGKGKDLKKKGVKLMKSLSILRKCLLTGAAGICAAFGSTQPAVAVEGGVGAYFMGTRDTLAGIVPPPGTYLSFSFDHLKGDVQGLSVGGLPIRADAEIELNLIRLGFTTAFDTKLWGATPALNVVVPIPDIALRYTAVTAPLAGQSVDDEVFGAGDISVTGILGWHRGNLHYSAALTVYAPTGSYDTASIDIPNREIEALSLSKNVWSFQPAFAATWLNPETGFEVSSAASLLFSTKNDATDYQTAPALQLEGAVVQRLRSGWGFGLTGYHYQQLDDDSGRGAEQTRAVLGADSLKARVSGFGPIITFSGGKLFGGDLSVKVKYVSEFEAKRRLESDVFTAVVSLAF